MRPRGLACFLSAVLLALGHASPSPADDRPQWGERHSRNMVSDETGLPTSFEAGRRDGQTGNIDPDSTEGVRWVARLGTQTNGSPVVAEGKVLVGTNNGAPRDERIEGDRGVLMCFDEADGRFLWQLVVPKMYEIKYSDWHFVGITSSPTVEDGRAYLLSNRCEVMCLDLEGMADGNQGPYLDEGRHMAPAGEPPLEPGPRDADILWLCDLVAEMGVRPHNASNCSILLDGNYLYVCTSNGVEWTHSHVANPEAPTMVVVDKRNGKVIARDDFGLGTEIIHGQWSSPAMAGVNGKKCVVLGAGDGALYGFRALEPGLGPDPRRRTENLWRFYGQPEAQTQDHVPLEHGFETQSYEVTSMPVFYKDRVYVGITQDPWHKGKTGWFVCVDATQTGDVTRSGLRWSYDGLGRCISTASIAGGLVYVADFDGRLHCLDAETGRCYWVHEAGEPIWGSTLVADGKIYLGTGRRQLWVLKAGKQLDVLEKIRMRDRVFTTPTAANGTLYVATEKHLYAVGR